MSMYPFCSFTTQGSTLLIYAESSKDTIACTLYNKLSEIGKDKNTQYRKMLGHYIFYNYNDI